jgi:hypothetical protein
MEFVLSKSSDPRNVHVWKLGFKHWELAGNVAELTSFIYKPPPVPQMSRSERWASQGIWRSVIAISIQSGVLLNDTSTAEPWPVVAGRISEQFWPLV